MRYGRGKWTVEVSSDWEFIYHDECVTLERPEGRFNSVQWKVGRLRAARSDSQLL